MLTEFIGKPRQPHDDERYATNDGLAKTQFLHAYEAGDGIGKTVSEGFILDAVNQILCCCGGKHHQTGECNEIWRKIPYLADDYPCCNTH